jgi:alpha-beta hydrolase superfamily lysophospholipase
LVHGFAERSAAIEARRVTALNRHGWNALAIDLRAYGQSEGEFATFGGHEARDILVWLDALSERVARDGSTVEIQPALWGRSMGAAIALHAAALDRRPVALVLESPMVDIHESTAVVLRRRRLPFPGLLARLVIRRASKLAGMPLDRPRPSESAARVACVTLVVHGSNDTVVSVADARRLADAFPSPPSWSEVPGAKHTDVIETGGDDLLDRIAAFLAEATTRKPYTRSDGAHDEPNSSLPGSVVGLFERPEDAADELG